MFVAAEITQLWTGPDWPAITSWISASLSERASPPPAMSTFCGGFAVLSPRHSIARSAADSWTSLGASSCPGESLSPQPGSSPAASGPPCEERR